ncbi:hypothetical protein BC828DRAFT_438629 [Blastocladiella britannica]|nr:hypothetical protein BC828DRAFT_438629 [Blastocladiella britannica]
MRATHTRTAQLRTVTITPQSAQRLTASESEQRYKRKACAATLRPRSLSKPNQYHLENMTDTAAPLLSAARLVASPTTSSGAIAPTLSPAATHEYDPQPAAALFLRRSASSHAHLLAALDDMHARLSDSDRERSVAMAAARTGAAQLVSREKLWAMERAALEQELADTRDRLARVAARSSSPAVQLRHGGAASRRTAIRSVSMGPSIDAAATGAAASDQLVPRDRYDRAVAAQRLMQRRVDELATALHTAHSALTVAETRARAQVTTVEALHRDLAEVNAVLAALRDQNEGFRLLLEDRTLRGEWSVDDWLQLRSPVVGAGSSVSGRGSADPSPIRRRKSRMMLRRKESALSLRAGSSKGSGSLSAELARAQQQQQHEMDQTEIAPVVAAAAEEDESGGGHDPASDSAVEPDRPTTHPEGGSSSEPTSPVPIPLRSAVAISSSASHHGGSGGLLSSSQASTTIPFDDNDGYSSDDLDADVAAALDAKNSELATMRSEIKALQLYISTILSRILTRAPGEGFESVVSRANLSSRSSLVDKARGDDGNATPGSRNLTDSMWDMSEDAREAVARAGIPFRHTRRRRASVGGTVPFASSFSSVGGGSDAQPPPMPPVPPLSALSRGPSLRRLSVPAVDRTVTAPGSFTSRHHHYRPPLPTSPTSPTSPTNDSAQRLAAWFSGRRWSGAQFSASSALELAAARPTVAAVAQVSSHHHYHHRRSRSAAASGADAFLGMGSDAAVLAVWDTTAATAGPRALAAAMAGVPGDEIVSLSPSDSPTTTAPGVYFSAASTTDTVAQRLSTTAAATPTLSAASSRTWLASLGLFATSGSSAATSPTSESAADAAGAAGTNGWRWSSMSSASTVAAPTTTTTVVNDDDADADMLALEVALAVASRGVPRLSDPPRGRPRTRTRTAPQPTTTTAQWTSLSTVPVPPGQQRTPMSPHLMDAFSSQFLDADPFAAQVFTGALTGPPRRFVNSGSSDDDDLTGNTGGGGGGGAGVLMGVEGVARSPRMHHDMIGGSSPGNSDQDDAAAANARYSAWATHRRGSAVGDEFGSSEDESGANRTTFFSRLFGGGGSRATDH